MNLNKKDVLENLNKIIVAKRLNKVQILHMINLVPISTDFDDLRDNLRWESDKIKY